MKLLNGRLWGLLIAAGLAGCAGPSTTEINASESGVFVPSARVAVEISPRDASPSQPHAGHGIEAAVSGGRGHDTQTLAAGQPPVVFGSQTFNAPNQLRHEFDLRFYELEYRYRNFFGDGAFGLEVLAGLVYADLGLTVSSATQRASERLAHAGGLLGGGLLWRLRQQTSLQSRFIGSGGNTKVQRFDLYLAQALGRNAGLRVGYASWTVKAKQAQQSTSDNPFPPSPTLSPINVRFSGPALGLEVMF